MTANGTLAGLVAITAPCAFVSGISAFIIGLVAGLLVCVSVPFIENKWKLDDPVGAISVHGVNGFWGVLSLGLFADGSYGDGINGVAGGVRGLFYGDGSQLLAQLICLGVLFCFWLRPRLRLLQGARQGVGLRVAPEDELEGVDHPGDGRAGLSRPAAGALGVGLRLRGQRAHQQLKRFGKTGLIEKSYATPVSQAVPVVQTTTIEASPGAAPARTGPKFTKVEIICKQSKFEALKSAMSGIGITGMTVTQVLGFGLQKGKTEFYRGVETETNLLPKVQVEIVVSKVPVRTVIETAKKVLYTGHIGDGKIFVTTWRTLSRSAPARRANRRAAGRGVTRAADSIENSPGALRPANWNRALNGGRTRRHPPVTSR